MYADMRTSTAMLLAVASTVAALSTDPTLNVVMAQMDIMLAANTASEVTLSTGTTFSAAVETMQGRVNAACSKINTAVTAANPTWSATQCEPVQSRFAQSATMAANMFKKVDELAKGDGFDGAQADSMIRLLADQMTNCDNAAAALEKACPSEKENIMGAQSIIDTDNKEAMADLGTETSGETVER